MLTILLLGPPQILSDGIPVTVSRRRARALVYYLAAQDKPVHRERLIDLFWHDHDHAAARQLLRTTLHSVRRVLGSAVEGDEEVTLALDADVDYRALVTAVTAPIGNESILSAALERYRDDLLTGFTLPDAPLFADWLEAERERARLLAMRGYTHLARIAEMRGDLAAALTALDRALTFDPLQEDLQREIMRLHYLSGDRVGAIRRYENLRDLLDAELGVPPMRETRELYDAIVTDRLLDSASTQYRSLESERYKQRNVSSNRPPPARHTLPSLLPFIGRSAEMEAIEMVGAGRLMLIEGETGIGKTRLAFEALERHTARGGLTLIAAARELEQGLPYRPWIDLLRDLLARPNWHMLRAHLNLDPLWFGEAARLLPELAPGSSATTQADEARLWEGVTRLLIALASLKPLMLLFDDLHWADASSLGLLGYVVRRAEEASVRLIATARTTDHQAALRILLNALTREGRLERILLRRLSTTDTEALARALSPDDAARLASWLYRNTEGNPFVIAELVRHARTTGLLSADGRLSPVLPDEPVVPVSVYGLIQSQLARLSDEARRVLDTAATVGRVFSFDVVARAAALSEEAALDALDELRAARLIEPLANGRFQFDHSLTMEVAYREMGEPRHRALHRRVAEALEALNRDCLDDVAGLIAWHFAEGGVPERAATYAVRAGRRAARVAAWTEAIAFYEQALAGLGASQRFDALMNLGEALVMGGKAAQAAERFRESLALARTPAEARRARLSLARALAPQGRYAEMIEAVRGLEQRGDLRDRITALFLWGTALSLEGSDLIGAALRLREAARLILAQPAPDPIALAQVRFELGSVAAQQGDLSAAVASYREALAATDSATAHPEALTWRILACNNLAYHLHLQGRLDEAEHWLDEGLRLANEYGMLGLQPYLLSTQGEIALARGNLDAAESSFLAGLTLAERMVVSERVAGITANLGLVALHRGHATLAIHHLSIALARADTLGTRHLAAQIRIWLAPLLPPDEARTVLAQARTIAESGGRRRLLADIARVEYQLRLRMPHAGHSERSEESERVAQDPSL
ncbi:ATP-binding protein [Roseiflexus castenholzii]|uniref:Transcriptional activator domain n=1 Tax=Roseiflexus castenholzii (strain DSM 13941 / HLO8) TaxID=383372 RepID=A7NS94_ROSCS|nr:AAA family ATPase [Roseiflexus castenholzii]ABU60440.1 transcriptional activator domain [Roseiflexus castenholzii DSM 13941]